MLDDEMEVTPAESRALLLQLRVVRRGRKILRWIEANPERVLAVGLLYLLGESFVRSIREKRGVR